MGVHKTVNGAYRYSLMPTYYVKGCSPLALPLGELSPQVTERVLQPFSNDNINLCTHITEIPVDIPVGESQNLQPKETSGIENVQHHKQAPEVRDVESHPIQ